MLKGTQRGVPFSFVKMKNTLLRLRVLKLLAENDISTFVIKLDDVDLITALNDLQGRRLIINQIKTVAGI